jgi:predicted AlkP superfamily phosphohydrolase/phosphomutase
MSVPGMVRFYLVRTEPEVELYASAVNFDPDAPPYPISSPPEYAKQLAAALGPFYTTGMVEEHTGLNNGRINEFAFLEQCEQVWRERERMLHYELDRQRQGLVFCLFDTSDRIQHMLWRHTEPDHPANRIFLNLGGRERQGIVSPDEVHQVEQQIIEGLSGLKDAATGDVGVRSVMRRSEVYTGACAAESPDLMVNCNAGYRIAWTSARGCVAGTQFENNDKRWSGDHIIDPALAPGMLLMNRSFMPRKCDLRDLAPTILAALGAPPAEAMEGQSLL